jgi:hypothetical protein
MDLTAASFGELGGRMPVAAGEAAYVREGFRSERWSAAVGLLVIGIAAINAAVVLTMGAIAAWGIEESVVFAGAITRVEIGGLLAMIAAGAFSGPESSPACPRCCRK